MKKKRMLICFDNFEDIEKPTDEQLSQYDDSKKQAIRNQYNLFKKLFDEWKTEYLNLRMANSTEIYSQF